MSWKPECTMDNMLKPSREAEMEPDAIDQTGGPAFPRAMYVAGDANDPNSIFDPGAEGMQLRDWFAGQALNALVAKNTGGAVWFADEAYRLADAMLDARTRAA